MAQKPETLFRKRVIADLKKLPLYFFPIQQISLRGDPDYILCVKGKMVGLELKKDALSKPMPLQLHKLRLIEAAGGYGLVAYPENWENVLSFISKLSKDKNTEKPECLALPSVN